MKIIYKSKYGAAEKYAEMLGKTLSCEVIDLKKAAKGETDVIFVGAVYGGEIRGFDKLVKKGSFTAGARGKKVRSAFPTECSAKSSGQWRKRIPTA